MTAQPKHRFTPEEYLALDRASDTKHEFFEGEVYDMVGGKPNHNIVCVNISSSLNSQLRDRPCLVFPSDQRVKSLRRLSYTYPDITVVCDEPDYFEGDTLINPTVIIEVISPSTENYDRGKKSKYFFSISSLKDFLLVRQDQPQIDHHTRTSETSWKMDEISGLDAVIDLPSIGCTLALSDVYRKVTFDETEPE
jgi:Uma2 family endonuclease